MHVDNILVVILIGFVSSRCLIASPISWPRDSTNSTNITDVQLDVNKVLKNQIRKIFTEKGIDRLCCPFGPFTSIEFGKFKGCEQNEDAKHLTIDVHDGNRTRDVTFQHLACIDERCHHCCTSNDLKILPTGFIFGDNKTINHHEYCLLISSSSVDIAICSNQADELKTARKLSAIAMIVSVAFIIVTIIVNAALPKLRISFNLKCFLCHLSSLATLFTSLSLMRLNGFGCHTRAVCEIIAHFAFLSAAMWTNAISFNVWRNITHKVILHNETKEEVQRKEINKLLLFMAYGWGLPALLLIIIDQIVSVFKDEFDSKYLYYQLPFCILIIMNTILIILATQKLKENPQETEKRVTHSDTTQEHFIWYLRLYIMMSPTSWIGGGISLFFQNEFVILMDLFNAAQGIIIFVLFHPYVLKSIKSRWSRWRRWRIEESVKLSAPSIEMVQQNLLPTNSTHTNETTSIPVT